MNIRKYVIFISIFIFGITLTNIFIPIANQSRDGFYIGGEWFVVILLLMVARIVLDVLFCIKKCKEADYEIDH